MENIINHQTIECQEKQIELFDDIDFIMSRLNSCSKQKLNNIKRLIDNKISNNKDYRSAFTTYFEI